MDDRPTIEVDYGLASSYDDGIEVNRKLTGKLRESIMKHERSHGVGRYNKQDFINDFQKKHGNFRDSFMFALQNPECLVGFMPFMYSYHYKIFTYNSSALFPFMYFGVIWAAFWWFIARISFIQNILGYTLLIILINTILLIITHRYVKKYGKKY